MTPDFGPERTAPPSLPLFAALAPLLGRLPFSPAGAPLERLAADAGVRTLSGRRLRFTPPQDDGLGYEARIWTRGEVETRPDNWHDFFNALVWLTFPRAKAALNARHLSVEPAPGAQRGRARDALTHFDECGVLLLSPDASLLGLVRDFRWRELFWARRAELDSRLRCLVFGHATYEQLLAPFRGLTAKAVLYEIDAAWLRLPLATLLAEVDRRLAGELAAGLHAEPRALHPLPLMGWPGVTPESENAAYYEDVWQFRPGRRRAGV